MTQNSPEFWNQAAQQFQVALSEGWTKALESFKTMDLGAAGMPGMDKLPGKSPDIHFSPDKLKELQQCYSKEALSLFSEGFKPPKLSGDRRFADAAWNDNPMAGYAAAVYMLNSRTLMGLADAVEADVKTRSRIRFAVEQWVAAAAPSNFLAFKDRKSVV